MKKLEEIEKEYEEFIVSEDFAENIDEATTYLTIRIDDLDERIAVLKKEKRVNKFNKITANFIVNFILPVLEGDPDFFDEDNEILDKALKMSISFKDYFNQLLSMADEENYKELIRLAVFAINYHNEHVDYIEYLRDKLENAHKGIAMYNPKYEDNIEVFDEFMRKELAKNASKKNKSMEKTKQM